MNRPGQSIAGAQEVADVGAQVPPAVLSDQNRGDRKKARTPGTKKASSDITTVVFAPPAPAPSGIEGAIVGRYKLLRMLGEGAFGQVYVAEQLRPVRRWVALKVVKPGPITSDVRRHFEAERQALAVMDHPGVCRLLDAETTARGRPFFVMELVRGLPITKYCDANHLSLPERFELFIQVCRAIEHVHQKGIIHRDIKPSNVLVTLQNNRPRIKVIDFGVAMAFRQEFTPLAVGAANRQLIGTPNYMSPEQARMDVAGIDTRTDIYSLGALLYELLVGTTPLKMSELRGLDYDVIRSLIQEQAPPEPSLRLLEMPRADVDSVANKLEMPRRRFFRQLRMDLDAVVMKAIARDPVDRYGTAHELCSDIQRFLTNQPVHAVRQTAWYSLYKFSKRNRGGMVMAAWLSLFLVGAAVVSTAFAVRSHNSLDKTLAFQQEAEISQRETVEFQRALDAADAGRWVWNYETDVLHWDAKMYEIFGRNPEDWSPQYGGFEECLHPDDRELVKAVVEKCIKDKSRYSAVFRALTEDGMPRYIRAYGKVDGAIMSGINIRVREPDYEASK